MAQRDVNSNSGTQTTRALGWSSYFVGVVPGLGLPDVPELLLVAELREARVRLGLGSERGTQVSEVLLLLLVVDLPRHKVLKPFKPPERLQVG